MKNHSRGNYKTKFTSQHEVWHIPRGRSISSIVLHEPELPSPQKEAKDTSSYVDRVSPLLTKDVRCLCAHLFKEYVVSFKMAAGKYKKSLQNVKVTF